MRPGALLLASVAVGGCAMAGPIRPAGSHLSAQEAVVLAKATEKYDGGFRRIWRSPDLRSWAYLKWDEERSSSALEAPRDLLQIMREEIGRLNRVVSVGPDLRLTLTVQRFRSAGFFRKAAVNCELVVRDDRGRLMWAAQGEVQANPGLGKSLADTDSMLVARELVRMVRLDLRRASPLAKGPLSKGD